MIFILLALAGLACLALHEMFAAAVLFSIDGGLLALNIVIAIIAIVTTAVVRKQIKRRRFDA